MFRMPHITGIFSLLRTNLVVVGDDDLCTVGGESEWDAGLGVLRDVGRVDGLTEGWPLVVHVLYGYSHPRRGRRLTLRGGRHLLRLVKEIKPSCIGFLIGYRVCTRTGD